MGKSALLLSLVLFCACAGSRSALPPAVDRHLAAHSGKYPLLNPILALDPAHDLNEIKPFNHKIKVLVDEVVRSGRATQVAVYFRGLENGPFYGANVDEKFSPVSLLKLPLMIASLKVAETYPGLLDRRARNDQEPSPAHYKTRTLERGAEYTVEELLRAMIVSSDNSALLTLRKLVPDEAVDVLFRDFGLVIPGVRGAEDSLSVREYASFFRILYNATYLNGPMSQKALAYLSDSEFKLGLVAGVPPGTVVAHKFGERYHVENSVKQLHDCGIVYYPEHHYVLCVMSRGSDFDALSSVIKDVSAMVYGEVATQVKFEP